MKKQDNKLLFLYGKLRHRNKAVYYCNLHKCYISRQNLFEKKFKCEKCKHKSDI